MIAPSSPPAAQHPLRQAGPVLAIVLGFLGLSVVVHAVALWHVASV